MLSDGKSRASQSSTISLSPFTSSCHITNNLILQRPFQLETINIQEKGQEKWKNKYVYWIPALHLEGKEIAKGRWDAAIVEQALARWDQDQAQPQATTEAELPTK